MNRITALIHDVRHACQENGHGSVRFVGLFHSLLSFRTGTPSPSAQSCSQCFPTYYPHLCFSAILDFIPADSLFFNRGNFENWAVKDAISTQLEKERKANCWGPHHHILIIITHCSSCLPSPGSTSLLRLDNYCVCGYIVKKSNANNVVCDINAVYVILSHIIF